MSEVIWVMDSDICEQCGGLIGEFGICLDCGDDGVDWDEEEWEDDFTDFGDSDEDQAEIGTLKYGYEEWVRGLPPMPAPADIGDVKETNRTYAEVQYQVFREQIRTRKRKP